jgi:hypothetical protein
MFEVGDRIIRKSNELCACVTSSEKRRVLMVEVKWDATGLKQWLPAEEFRLWDKSDPPPPVRKTRWGRTTPGYIIGLRSSAQCYHERQQRLAKNSTKRLENLTEALCSLSDRKKGRSQNKARKLIKKFNRGEG